MKHQIEILNILHMCAEIESTLAQVYEFFTIAYPNNQEITRLFAKTAAEERTHEYQFKLAIKSCAPLISDLNVSLQETEKHLVYARNILIQVHERTPPVEEALRISINCETIFSQFHMDTAVRFSDTAGASLFKAMMAADDEHASSLKKALDKLKENA
ncbi:MAG: ferritin family protein [Geobacteraceae bacterium]|nr:ferritin family protein [Geobacteraceae bacterium]